MNNKNENESEFEVNRKMYGHEYDENWLDRSGNRRPRSFAAGVGTGILMVLIVLAVLTAVVLGYLRYRQGSQSVPDSTADSTKTDVQQILTQEVQEKIDLLSEYLQEYYYEDLDKEDLVEGLYAGVFSGAGDPYTEYYTAEQYEELNQQTSGSYYGIGAAFQQDLNTNEVVVDRVYEGTPAEEAGLKAGDNILYVDEHRADSMELSELVTYIKGEKDTSVHFQVERGESKEKVEMDIFRAEVEIPTVSGEMLEGDIGYIGISEFSSVTSSQFEKMLAELQTQGMKKMIIDLRGNPGGTVTSVTEILDDILPEGLMVYTENKSGEREEYTSDAEHFLDIPMAVLIDKHSASASEIFAGAIQDFDYGTIIGTTSFGKGIVQTIMPLNDGSAMKITTARYFTPNGNYIHEVGISPDIEVEYEYTGSETEFEYTGDNQIMKAVEVLNNES
ncbi:MAG: S41 family peptidase [Eubacterium sp.]|jgi:C-terminal peptidase (prc)|nr:S41 family peptidase [Eubacterium sp.]